MLTAKQMRSLYPYARYDYGEAEVKNLADAISEAASWYRESLVKQLITNKVDNDIRMRPSMMGKAAIDCVAHKFFPELYQDKSMQDRFWQLFHDGDTWESDYYIWLALAEIEVLETQADCNWHGIEGHADMVVAIDGKRVLLELKTCDTGYYNSMLKMQSDADMDFLYGEEWLGQEWLFTKYSDFRGHITQGAIYGDALNCDEVVVVLKHKDSSKVSLYNIKRSEINEALARCSAIVEVWDTSETWADVFLRTGIPTPAKELKNKNHTGRYLVNPRLYGSPIIPLVYEWSPDTKTDKVIVEGYRVPEYAFERLPENLRDEYEQLDIYTYEQRYIPTLLREWAEFQELRRS